MIVLFFATLLMMALENTFLPFTFLYRKDKAALYSQFGVKRSTLFVLAVENTRKRRNLIKPII